MVWDRLHRDLPWPPASDLSTYPVLDAGREAAQVIYRILWRENPSRSARLRAGRYASVNCTRILWVDPCARSTTVVGAVMGSSREKKVIGTFMITRLYYV
jgi:hypothetical protein